MFTIVVILLINLVELIISEVRVAYLELFSICYFKITILLLNQVNTMPLSGNNEYHTRSKDNINADPPNFLSALFKVETKLMQNNTNLKTT